MAAKRKLWSTTQGPEDLSVAEKNRRRHESEAMAYRYVRNDAINYAARGGRGYTYTDVWVDERDGYGWRHYERIELADLAPAEEEHAEPLTEASPQRFGEYARERLEAALRGLAADASDIEVLGPAAEALMALHMYYGSTTPFTVDPTDVVERIDRPEPTCICPADLVARGGFRSGCPVHHMTETLSNEATI